MGNFGLLSTHWLPNANIQKPRRAGENRQWHEIDIMARCYSHQPEELLYVRIRSGLSGWTNQLTPGGQRLHEKG